MKQHSQIVDVFSLSVVNGADNRQDYLPEYKWAWPKDTYLQKRLKEKRDRERREERKDNV